MLILLIVIVLLIIEIKDINDEEITGFDLSSSSGTRQCKEVI